MGWGANHSLFLAHPTLTICSYRREGLGGQSSLGQLQIMPCKKERKKERNAFEYKVRNSTKCQDGLDGWVDMAYKRAHLFLKVGSWLLGFSKWIEFFLEQW